MGLFQTLFHRPSAIETCYAYWVAYLWDGISPADEALALRHATCIRLLEQCWRAKPPNSPGSMF